MEFRIDPDHEISYRIRLAKRYLRDAEEAFLRGDYRNIVASSQLAAENAAKAIIAVYRIPSWSHDPSNELRELLTNMPMNIRSFVEELAEITESLAPEYGRATYGEPLQGLTPWEIYDRDYAGKVLEKAR
jgi:HEPN domain-containing protein